MDHLNKSDAVEAMRLLSFDEKCVRAQVPKKLHYVWFGSELPEKYVSNIKDMAAKNPGWDVFLWSEFASSALEIHLANQSVPYTFKNITRLMEEGAFVNADLITKEENLAGKSDYLRLEVVYLEGGIYQDTDAHALRPFDSVDGLFRWPFLSYDPFTYQVSEIGRGERECS